MDKKSWWLTIEADEGGNMPFNPQMKPYACSKAIGLSVCYLLLAQKIAKFGGL